MRKFLLRVFPFLSPCHKGVYLIFAALRRGGGWMVGLYTKMRFNIFWECYLKWRVSPTPKPIVHVYVVCRNERKILPYFLDHYQKISEHIFVYDQGSTDGSLRLLAEAQNLTVVPVETDGKFDELTNIHIKNTVWKQSVGKADFVVVCDMDEFLYHPRLDQLLVGMKRKRFTLLKPHGYQMVSEILPDFDGETSLTSILTEGVSDENNYSKMILFDPNRVEINFRPGSHRADPTGEVKVCKSDVAKLLHYKFVDRETVVRKTRAYRTQMSDQNLTHGYSRHYMVGDDEVHGAFDSFIRRKERVIPRPKSAGTS